MLHLHLLFLPFFLMFHVISAAAFFLGLLILSKMLSRHRGGSCMARHPHAMRSGESENGAFDEYRQATLDRLEREAEEFRKYLDGLRRAADSAAFDAFLKSRRAGGAPT